MNIDVWELEGMNDLINNLISVFIFVVMIHMIIVQVG
jgi:hypothetical protein